MFNVRHKLNHVARSALAIMFRSINRFSQFYLQGVRIMQDFEILFLSFVAVLDKSENSWFVDLWPKGTFNH